MKYYKYGMRLRGFSIGCQPIEGLVRREDAQYPYYDYVIYNRKLSRKELKDFELDYIDTFEKSFI